MYGGGYLFAFRYFLSSNRKKAVEALFPDWDGIGEQQAFLTASLIETHKGKKIFCSKNFFLNDAL